MKLKRKGLSKDDPDSEFDRVQLDIGTKIETEHTEDKESAKEIAKDHLVEDPDYYKKLSRMEAKSMKKARYIKRWKGKDGKWHYTYKEQGTEEKVKRINALAESIEKKFNIQTRVIGKTLYTKGGYDRFNELTRHTKEIQNKLKLVDMNVVHLNEKPLPMKKAVLLLKANLPVGTIRKYGQSFYKKTATKGWQRVPTRQGRTDFEKQEAKGKIGIKPKKLKTTRKPTKKKAQTKKTPTKINEKTKIAYNRTSPIKQKKYTKEVVKKPVVLKTKTQQYIDKLKKISIMNKLGKEVYLKQIKEAIANKDKKTLDLVFKDIENWSIRNKQFQKRKKMTRRVGR